MCENNSFLRGNPVIHSAIGYSHTIFEFLPLVWLTVQDVFKESAAAGLPATMMGPTDGGRLWWIPYSNKTMTYTETCWPRENVFTGLKYFYYDTNGVSSTPTAVLSMDRSPCNRSCLPYYVYDTCLIFSPNARFHRNGFRHIVPFWQKALLFLVWRMYLVFTQ